MPDKQRKQMKVLHVENEILNNSKILNGKHLFYVERGQATSLYFIIYTIYVASQIICKHLLYCISIAEHIDVENVFWNIDRSKKSKEVSLPYHVTNLTLSFSFY